MSQNPGSRRLIRTSHPFSAGFTVLHQQRDIKTANDTRVPAKREGRNMIAVIGIDRYRHTQHWRRLSNAVSDARVAVALFERLGFEEAVPALIDDDATGRAMQSLVTDELTKLDPDDSLVLFYAGHGGNRKHRMGDHDLTTAYLIPVDGEDRVATWVELEAWLRAVALLPARHILVILDACHSGFALDPVIKWRDGTSFRSAAFATLNARRSRRIITSALGDQRAMDNGPHPGHSLFTGCLIEALTHGLRGSDEPMTTGSELGLYLQRRVTDYPHSQQTPDFGTFAFDDRGEMVIELSPMQRKEPLRASSALVELTSQMESSHVHSADPTMDKRFSRHSGKRRAIHDTTSELLKEALIGLGGSMTIAQAIARIFAHAIRAVRNFSTSEHWTLNNPNNLLRLNIGMVEVLTMNSSGLEVVALPKTLPEAAREEINRAGGKVEPTPYKTVQRVAPGGLRIDVPLRHVPQLEQLLCTNVQAYIIRDTSTARSPHRRAFSVAAICAIAALADDDGLAKVVVKTMSRV